MLYNELLAIYHKKSYHYINTRYFKFIFWNILPMKELFPGVYLIDNYIHTENMNKGYRVYNERLVKKDGKEFRVWDPFRSKLAAAIKKGLKNFPFSRNTKVLYLGASTGTTVSHVSDIVVEGEIYAVEISSQSMKSLLALAEKRKNIVPILSDASKPREYEAVGEVDIIYQDIAQPHQAEILIVNAEEFLKPSGIAMIAIKSQSIDVTKEPKKVFEEVLAELKKKFELLESYTLEPFDKDHLFCILRKI